MKTLYQYIKGDNSYFKLTDSQKTQLLEYNKFKPLI